MAYLDVIGRLENAYQRVYKPPPQLTVAQWAEEYLYLSPEDSAEAGKYYPDRAPYQRGMLEAVSDPDIREVVYCTSSQVGKTLMAKAILGFYIHQDPCPIVVIQPTVEFAETFSKDRLSTMIRDTPVLKSLIADPKSKTSGNTIRHKLFPGGHVTMIGANAPTDLAGRPIRVIFADEVDRYPVSAGTEGDPLFLARQRSVNYWNRKFVVASTPTNEGLSRIWAAFEKSDQRHYYLPCPHCGEFHILKWQQIIWDKDDPSTAKAACPVCGGLYENADKLRMLAHGEWRPHAKSAKVAGFHISALYSPWQSFADIVQEFLDKKDHPETLKTFVNLQLGECWEDRSGEAIDANALMARRENWDLLPADIVVITAGVDTQGDRLECTLVGWTLTEQARVIHHARLLGSPDEPEVWKALDELLLTQRETEDGRFLSPRATCIDSGGHHTKQVYEFAGARVGRRVFAIKGKAGKHKIWPDNLSKKQLRNGARLHWIGVDTAKDTLYSSLSVIKPDLPHYISFSTTIADDYFAQLTVERRVTSYNKAGHQMRSWILPKNARNEALDCWVYALAGLEFLKTQTQGRLKAVYREQVMQRPTLAPVVAPVKPTNAATRRPAAPTFEREGWAL